MTLLGWEKWKVKLVGSCILFLYGVLLYVQHNVKLQVQRRTTCHLTLKQWIKKEEAEGKDRGRHIWFT